MRTLQSGSGVRRRTGAVRRREINFGGSLEQVDPRKRVRLGSAKERDGGKPGLVWRAHGQRPRGGAWVLLRGPVWLVTGSLSG